MKFYNSGYVYWLRILVTCKLCVHWGTVHLSDLIILPSGRSKASFHKTSLGHIVFLWNLSGSKKIF